MTTMNTQMLQQWRNTWLELLVIFANASSNEKSFEDRMSELIAQYACATASSG